MIPGLIELSILIPFVLWSINEAQKNSQQNNRQNSDISDLHHCIDRVGVELKHHIDTSEIRLESMSNVIDKIWDKME